MKNVTRSKKPPQEVFSTIQRELWTRADQLAWAQLSDSARSQYYEQWTREPQIGGALGLFLDPRAVRVYLKDTVMKPYLRDQLNRRASDVLRVLGLAQVPATHFYIKPHGRRLTSDCVVCWGNSRDWKAILMATFERAHDLSPSGKSLVALFETGRTSANEARALVRTAARRLGVERLEWLE
jgi:hypothetical protein